jgi:predicted metal-dependent hydrolase
MLQDAIDDLYEEFPYQAEVKYSGKFKPYNANVQLYNKKLTFKLSKSWKNISREIQIGLVQELLLKILKKRLKSKKKQTTNTQLYNFFMQKIHIAIPKTKSDPVLEESFKRVNNEYFLDLIEQPNLKWGNGINKLGSYEFGTDTISISTTLEQHPSLLDYVMYHEMLHKKEKFYTKNGRSYHHTTNFRKKEKQFKDSDILEKELSKLVRKSKTKRFFFRNL